MCSAVACFPGAIAVIPFLIRHGVFGMIRMTGTGLPRKLFDEARGHAGRNGDQKVLRREIVGNLPQDFLNGLRLDAQQNKLRLADGFTVRKRRLNAELRSQDCSSRSGCAAVAMNCFFETMPASIMPVISASPSFPAPRTAIFCSRTWRSLSSQKGNIVS